MGTQGNWGEFVISSGFVLGSPTVVVSIISGMSFMLEVAYVNDLSCHKEILSSTRAPCRGSDVAINRSK